MGTFKGFGFFENYFANKKCHTIYLIFFNFFLSKNIILTLTSNKEGKIGITHHEGQVLTLSYVFTFLYLADPAKPDDDW